MYTNYNLHDRLRVCLVGQSWPREFYNWIKDSQVRETMQRIATETEEDFLHLISVLEGLQVQVLRPKVDLDFDSIQESGNILDTPTPPMCPGDNIILFGDQLIESISTAPYSLVHQQAYQPFFDHVREQGNHILTTDNISICTAQCFQFEDRMFYGKMKHQSHTELMQAWKKLTDKSIVGFHLDGHIDGWFCPVAPGLIVTAPDTERPSLLSLFYKTHFNDWKIVYCDPTLYQDPTFRRWQKQNTGAWWVPGEEKNHEFIKFVNTYFKNWIGNVSETVFEANMIVVDDKTVIVRKTNNARIIQELENYGITVYQVPFRHSNFWDAGLNCVTMAVHRSK